jgi:methylated-DNA-[protein]-cysteine S-methyltransferase
VIAYAPIDTRVGRLWAVITDRGLARLVLPGLPDRELTDQLPLGRPDAREDPAALAEVADALTRYLAGDPAPFAIPLDLTGVAGFRRDVLEAMATIPRGEAWTYAELAAEAGRPRAVRAAGTGCATNPLPILIPCHRVVRSDGMLGNYGGGVAMKADLLTLEGLAVTGTPPRVPLRQRAMG